MNQWQALLHRLVFGRNKTDESENVSRACSVKSAKNLKWLLTSQACNHGPPGPAALDASVGGGIGWRASALLCQMEHVIPMDLKIAPAWVSANLRAGGSGIDASSRAQGAGKRITVFRVRPGASAFHTSARDRPSRQNEGSAGSGHSNIMPGLTMGEGPLVFYTCTNGNAGAGIPAGNNFGNESYVALQVHRDVQRWWPSCGDLRVDAFMVLVGSGDASSGVCKPGECHQVPPRPQSQNRCGPSRGERKLDVVCLALQRAAHLDALSLADGAGADVAGMGSGRATCSAARSSAAYPVPFAPGDRSVHKYDAAVGLGSSSAPARETSTMQAAFPCEQPAIGAIRSTQTSSAMSWTIRSSCERMNARMPLWLERVHICIGTLSV